MITYEEVDVDERRLIWCTERSNKTSYLLFYFRNSYLLCQFYFCDYYVWNYIQTPRVLLQLTRIVGSTSSSSSSSSQVSSSSSTAESTITVSGEGTIGSLAIKTSKETATVQLTCFGMQLAAFQEVSWRVDTIRRQ